jgi:hypothetical protein
MIARLENLSAELTLNKYPSTDKNNEHLIYLNYLNYLQPIEVTAY